MGVANWEVYPRGVDLRRDFDPVLAWSSLTVVERHNVLGVGQGAWTLTAASDSLRDLLVPGRGVILLRGSGDGAASAQIMSGPTTSIKRGPKTSTISGVSDLSSLNRILYPDPTKPITAQPAAYDDRSGPAEDLVLGYSDSNAGPSALPARRVFGLRIPASQHRGARATLSGRLDLLTSTISDLAESGGLHVEVIHAEDAAGPYLTFVVRPVTDRSANVRFGTVGDFTGGTIGSDWSYELNRPTTTDAIVAGGGQGTARTFREATDAVAESTWGAKVETLVDQRQTTDPDELDRAGTDALNDGSEPVSISFTIGDSADVRYRRDWQVGDRVGVSIDGIDVSNVVREVTTTITRSSNSATERISALVGSRDSSAWTTKSNRDTARALRELAKLKAV